MKAEAFGDTLFALCAVVNSVVYRAIIKCCYPMRQTFNSDCLLQVDFKSKFFKVGLSYIRQKILVRPVSSFVLRASSKFNASLYYLRVCY